MAEKNVGHVVQVIGPVLDIQFEEGHLPSIYNAVQRPGAARRDC
jgi:F-type H+-transporting ATPase subunit beta